MNLVKHIGTYFLMIRLVFIKPTKQSIMYGLVLKEIQDLILGSLGIVCFLSFFVLNWMVVAFFYSFEFLQAAFLLFWPFIICIILRLCLRQSIGSLDEVSFKDVFIKVKLFRRVALVISSVSFLSSITWGSYFNLKTVFF